MSRQKTLQDLYNLKEHWRLSATNKFKMASADVMPEHLIAKVAHALASSQVSKIRNISTIIELAMTPYQERREEDSSKYSICCGIYMVCWRVGYIPNVQDISANIQTLFFKAAIKCFNASDKCQNKQKTLTIGYMQ
jgi:hypothetical protein